MDSFFERFPDKEYDAAIYEKLFNFSQKKDTRATFIFSEDTVDETTGIPTTRKTPVLFHGFRTIVSEAIIRFLGLEDSIFVTPLITILGYSVLYDKSNTNANHALSKQLNKSFIGILDIDDLHSKFNIQTKKQQNINAKRTYSMDQEAAIMDIQVERELLLGKYNEAGSLEMKKLQKNSDSFYKLPHYSLFTNETRRNFVTKTALIAQQKPDIPAIIIIPVNLLPFNYMAEKSTNTGLLKEVGHAQYIYINRIQKMYTIIDGQFDPYKSSNDARVKHNLYHDTIRKELEGIDTLVEEIMGEQFEPYMYSVECPQAIVLDKNCIWWSMLIMYLFIQSDPNAANYGSILLELKDKGRRDKTFLSRVMNLFKVFVLEHLLVPMLENGTLEWRDLDIFLNKNFPGLSPNAEARERKRMNEIQKFYEEQAAAAAVPRAGPAVIVPYIPGRSGNPNGGRRKKLTSKTRATKRTHSRYGKHTRKSHRR